ncbi:MULTISPECIES: hypothetical protein [Pseudomonas]|uniref:hypothetical protein n=1 Tax=Pseudomonas TaxID=286 RepID=UPI0009089FC4|nr:MULTISPECIES: hypothetical protein [Pseudomonas]TCV68186.1 hypothetical protein EDB98_10356 [Pseudomonas fluorescens]SFW48105.1 hypothetical protein SAMN03159439_02146 [Pseudomonas sp. NFACC04-2]
MIRSPAAAQSHARMSAVSLDSGFDVDDDALHGTLALEAYLQALVQNDGLGARG